MDFINRVFQDDFAALIKMGFQQDAVKREVKKYLKVGGKIMEDYIDHGALLDMRGRSILEAAGITKATLIWSTPAGSSSTAQGGQDKRSDGGYNDFTPEETDQQMRAYHESGVSKIPLTQDEALIGLELALGHRSRFTKAQSPRSPPEDHVESSFSSSVSAKPSLRVIESDRETFGATYYEHTTAFAEANTIYFERPFFDRILLSKQSVLKLASVIIHELNGKSHAEDVLAQKYFLVHFALLKLTASDATGSARGLIQYLPVVMPRASGDPKGRPLTNQKLKAQIADLLIELGPLLPTSVPLSFDLTNLVGRTKTERLSLPEILTALIEAKLIIRKAALKAQVSIETFRLALLRHGLLEEHFNSTSPTRELGHGEAAVKRRKQRMKIIQIPAEASETKADAAIVSPRKPGTRIPKHTDEEILAVLKATGNDKRQAAKRLKISLATIYNRLGQIRLKMAKLSGSPPRNCLKTRIRF